MMVQLKIKQKVNTISKSTDRPSISTIFNKISIYLGLG